MPSGVEGIFHIHLMRFIGYYYFPRSLPVIIFNDYFPREWLPEPERDLALGVPRAVALRAAGLVPVAR